MKRVRKRGNQIIIGDNKYNLADFDAQKNEILEELKTVKYNNLVDLLYRFQLTFDEIMDILDLRNIPSKRTGYSLPPCIYGVSDVNKPLEHISHDNVKLSNTIDDIRLKSNLNNKSNFSFHRKVFFIRF